MQRRLLIIALVFVAGFGVGYGITWLLVGSSGREVAPEQQAQGTPTRPPERVAERPTAAPPATSPAADAQGAAPDDAGVAPAADAVAVDAGPTAAPAAPDATATALATAKAAWEVCHLHECRLDFGKVSGGISIREGSLEHGQKVDWDRDFAKADKAGTLEAGPNVRVEVLAIGLTDGEPSAAYILRKTRREQIKGVIALRIGDKQLQLVPIE